MSYNSPIIRSKSNSTACSKINMNFRKNCISSSKIKESSEEKRRSDTKKRGVYVQRFSNPYFGNGNVSEIAKLIKKAIPARSNKNEKKFIDSVLNILSKDSAGNQYTDVENLKKKKKLKLRKNRDKKCKPKCKSRSHIKKNVSADEKDTALQSNNDLTMDSPISIKLSLVSPDTLRNNTHCSSAQRINTAISDGPNEIESKYKPAGHYENENKMYSFLEEFIKANIGVYKRNKSEMSQTDLLTDEQMIIEKTQKIETKQRKTQTNLYKTPNINNLKTKIYRPSQTVTSINVLDSIIDVSLRFPFKPISVRKLPSVEFKSGGIKSKKWDFGNQVKQQLERDESLSLYFQEPETFFDTLKLNMKNKKKAKKFVSGNSECVLSPKIERKSTKKLRN